MSQEFNSQEETQSTQQPQQPPKKDYTKVYWVVIALLLISNVILLVSRNKVAKDRDSVQAEYNYADSSRMAVEADYNAALVRLDELVSKNSAMEGMLSDRDGEIAKLRNQIDKIIKNKNATKILIHN